MEQIERIEKAKSFQTTQAMKNAARRGLELREKWNRGGLDTRQASEEGVGSGVARARDIITKSYTLDSLEDGEFNTEDDLINMNIPIAKSTNEEKRLATFLVLEPQDEDGTTNDLHYDWYDAEMVEKSCYNFNKYCMKANLLHLMPTSAFEFVESYIQKTDMILGDKFIKKGSWLATIYVDESPLGQQIWDGIKSGHYNGLSIQAMGRLENMS